jgi:hypothetical protein
MSFNKLDFAVYLSSFTGSTDVQITLSQIYENILSNFLLIFL